MKSVWSPEAFYKTRDAIFYMLNVMSQYMGKTDDKGERRVTVAKATLN